MTRTLDVIIVGGGRVGHQTAELLVARNDTVAVVEQDSEVVERLADAWIATVIRGDGTDPGILEQAGVESADVIAALTGVSGVNLAACLVAERLSPDIRTVARIERADADAYGELVDEVVFPERAGARVAANRIAGDDIQTIADVTGDIEVMEVRVAKGAPAAGRSLRDIRFPSGTLVVSDDDGDQIARPETTVDAGKRYVVAAEPDVVDEVLALLRG